MADFRRSGFGIIIVLLVASLLATGCTQPAGTKTGTATPTATLSVTVNVSPNATPDISELKADMAALAGTFAGEINRTALVTVATEGRTGPAFTTLLDQLRAFRARDSRIVFVYTLAQQNGTVRFIADANYGQAGATQFLQEYPDAPAELARPVVAPIGAGPYTDAWGTFVSGFAPVMTGPDGTIYIIGIDTRV